jgi:hypothetical protein
VLFLMNNAAGPDELVAALGAERVMPVRFVAVPVGEVDGRITERTRQVASLLDAMRDKLTRIRTAMDAWLVTHVSALAGILGVYAAEVGLFGHAAQARDEVQHLLWEFRARVSPGGEATAPLDRLAAFVDESVPPMPEGRSDLPPRWGSLLALGGTAAAVAATRLANKR